VLDGPAPDAYRPKRKAQGPVVCPDCGALFRKGRWQWAEAPAGAAKRRCPACVRAAEGAPGGYISLRGGFFAAHREEVLGRVRNCEAAERSRHPLERVIAITRARGGALVTTTSVHLARRVGHALMHAFKGELDMDYQRGENLLRVRWSREAGGARA
jgi:hypothetical protein